MEGEAVPHCSVGIIGVLDIMYVPYLSPAGNTPHKHYKIELITKASRANVAQRGQMPPETDAGERMERQMTATDHSLQRSLRL